MNDFKIPKKLIEVALPLDDINVAAAREKSIRHGHPSTLHFWWARRPLAAARAVIFAQMVNDPGFETGGGFRRGLKKAEAEKKREELFQIIRDLVKWKNTNNEEVLHRARGAIWESWRETCELNKKHPKAKELFNPEKLPAFHDPFAGGGAIPLEAQRLGLKSYASDLNPVAVMINKAMIEIPPKFAGRAPVGPIPKGEKQSKMPREWHGTQGLAEDVRRYGHWMREEAYKHIGHLYPKVKITKVMAKDRPDLKRYVGQKLTVIAWLWARTVKSPNPAFSHVDVPLVSSFILSKRKGKEVYVLPIIQGGNYEFSIKLGVPTNDIKEGTKVGRGGNFKCLLSGAPIPVKNIREQGKNGTLKQKMMAIIVESKDGQLFIPPIKEHEEKISLATPSWLPDIEVNYNPKNITTQLYGLEKYSDLFTNRQLAALSSFSDLIGKLTDKIYSDAKQFFGKDKRGIEKGGEGAFAYAEAISLFMALATGRSSSYWSSLAVWVSGGGGGGGGLYRTNLWQTSAANGMGFF